METQELTVEETKPGTTSIVQTCGEGAIDENLTVSPATQRPPSSNSAFPTLPTLVGLWQLTLGWEPTALQQAQLQQLYTLILAGNHQFNLTRITEPTEFWEKHLWDSLVGVKAFLQAAESQELPLLAPQAQQEAMMLEEASGSAATEVSVDTTQTLKPLKPFKAIDIGTGAGFPGLPVAIARPDWTVTLLDSTRKKMTFLDQVLATMRLANAMTLTARVEQVGRQRHQRETYDLALIRAVAAANVCAEYALPLLKIGGCAVLYRGHWSDAETASLEGAIAVLGGKIDTIEAFTTPLAHGDRHCIYLKKIAPTSYEFPRSIGIPTQNPL